MTLPSQTLTELASGNGVTKDFPFAFKALFSEHVAVYIIDDVTGDRTKQTMGTHYSVNGVGNDNGGTVTFVTAPVTGKTVFISSETPLTQEAAYVEGEKFPAKSHEGALDKIVRMMQERARDVDRCLKVPVEDEITLELPNAIARANSFMFFDEFGQMGIGDPEGIATTAVAAKDAAVAAQAASEAAAASVPANVETRLTAVEGGISTLEGDMAAVDGAVSTVQASITSMLPTIHITKHMLFGGA